MDATYDTLPLLRKGWGAQKMREEQIRLATPLVAQGVQFVGFPSAEVEATAVATFNAEMITGSTAEDNLQGVAALDSNGTLIGAVTLGPLISSPDHSPSEKTLAVLVRYLAVAPDWRHHGIGTVLLCIMDQHGVPGDVTRRVFFGGCAPEEARFYQRAGFDVLQPGTPVPGDVLGSGVDFANINAEYPCCFIRPWSQQA